MTAGGLIQIHQTTTGRGFTTSGLTYKTYRLALVYIKGNMIYRFQYSIPGDPEEFAQIYRKAGFTVLETKSLQHEGIESVMEILKDKTSAFCGNSGAGKSTLLNAIDPRLSLDTGDISQKLGRGRHTTRHVELYELPSGGFVADTPGFSAVDLEKFQIILKDELEGCFREMRQYEGKCRFRGCSHTKEAGCAVLEAVKNGEISQSRHQSYLNLYELAKNIKEWEIGR